MLNRYAQRKAAVPVRRVRQMELLQHDGAETVGLVLNVYCIRHISVYKGRPNVSCRLVRSVEWNFIKPVLWGLSVCNYRCRVCKQRFVTDETREMWSRNDMDTDNRNYVEDCKPLGCDTASLDESLPTFRMDITSSSSVIYWSILDRPPNP